jgi:hypothetical protein
MQQNDTMCSSTAVYEEDSSSYLVCPIDHNACGERYHSINGSDEFMIETEKYLASNGICVYELYAHSNFTGSITVTAENILNTSVKMFKLNTKYELEGLLDQDDSIRVQKLHNDEGVIYKILLLPDGTAPHVKLKVTAWSWIPSDDRSENEAIELAAETPKEEDDEESP